MNNVARWASVLLLVGVAVAQAPVVPAAPYGPPSCSLQPPTAYKDKIQIAHDEQQLGAADGHALISAEPIENFGITRYKLTEYGECTGKGGCYWADLDAQYKRAEAALAAQVASKKRGEKLALVMDIDETSLSSYCEMKREDFGFIKPMNDPWTISAEAAVAIPGALRLFKDAKAAGVDVFFITGRPGVPDYSVEQHGVDQTESTARNLEAAGFHGWAGLALRNGAENAMTTMEYKSSERYRIVQKGYRIVLNVGDQWSDLQGDPKGEISVKLPNPFYFLP